MKLILWLLPDANSCCFGSTTNASNALPPLPPPTTSTTQEKASEQQNHGAQSSSHHFTSSTSRSALGRSTKESAPSVRWGLSWDSAAFPPPNKKRSGRQLTHAQHDSVCLFSHYYGGGVHSVRARRQPSFPVLFHQFGTR